MTARGDGLALTQYLAVVRKEIRQTMRDRRVLFLLVAAPLLQTVLFGYAVDYDVDRLPTAVVDLDRTAAARLTARRLLADGTLQATATTSASAGARVEPLLDDREAFAVLLLHPDFGADLAAGRPARAPIGASTISLDKIDKNRCG